MVGQDRQHDTPAASADDADPSSAADDSTPDTTNGESSPETADRAATGTDRQDDLRRKFRESLQRKRHQQHEQRSADSSRGSSKVQDGFGPTRGRREFRRKSGG